ncbi:MAG TPA: N-methyl-L-tryptophan oxidase [Acetobacteraceae bacterium]|nr:N-methyl-L-tryptophan oxidase [Acetobacteraceae bacterium]
MQAFDIAIVGLGAMGSASLYHLAKSGARVVGIDRFAPPHNQGSSHGETRITRRAIGEGEAYVPLAIRSHQLWRDIEAQTGASLLHEIGSLLIARPGDPVHRPGRTGFLDRTIAAATRFAIPHELLPAAEIRHRFPNFTPDDAEIGYYEPGGGYLRVEACIAANLELSARHGATTMLGTQVLSITPDGAGLRLKTTTDDILAGQVAVSAGPWAGQLLGEPFASILKPTRQVMHWFEIAPDHADIWANSPVFMWPHGESEDGFFYGFPSLDGSTMKTADEFYGKASNPDAIDRMVPPSDSARMYQAHLANRFLGLTGHTARTATCIYTATADSAFVIDRHPAMDNVLVVSPCSGHGFKHSAAIGEAVAATLLGQSTPLDLTPFALARLL